MFFGWYQSCQTFCPSLNAICLLALRSLTLRRSLLDSPAFLRNFFRRNLRLDHENFGNWTQFMAKALKSNKYVYLFGNKKADGNGSMKPLLGGKGANLAEMSRIGLPVPPGFTMTTEVCTYYYDNQRTYPKVLEAQARDGMAFLEKIMSTKFGDKSAMPLLVS